MKNVTQLARAGEVIPTPAAAAAARPQDDPAVIKHVAAFLLKIRECWKKGDAPPPPLDRQVEQEYCRAVYRLTPEQTAHVLRELINTCAFRPTVAEVNVAIASLYPDMARRNNNLIPGSARAAQTDVATLRRRAEQNLKAIAPAATIPGREAFRATRDRLRAGMTAEDRAACIAAKANRGGDLAEVLAESVDEAKVNARRSLFRAQARSIALADSQRAEEAIA